MRTGSYLVSGLIGGLLGAVAWVAIAFFTGYSMAWIAWGVGLGVGMAIRFSAQERMGWHIGVVGAICGALSIGAGKAGMVFLSLDTPEDMPVAMVADEVIQERLEAGQKLKWEADNYVVAADSLAADYPPEVWDEAMIRWASMTPDQQQPYEIAVAEQIGSAFLTAFLGSFALFDFLWLGLGVATAYRVGAGFDFGDQPVNAPSNLVHVPVHAAKGVKVNGGRKHNARRAENDDEAENNFFRRMRPVDDDDMPSLGGASSEAA